MRGNCRRSQGDGVRIPRVSIKPIWIDFSVDNLVKKSVMVLFLCDMIGSRGSGPSASMDVLWLGVNVVRFLFESLIAADKDR